MVGLTGNSVKVQSRHETSEEAWSSIAFAQISLNFLKKKIHIFNMEIHFFTLKMR